MIHPYSPNLVVGGTYSGYLVIWDVRAKSQPIQRTSISQAHSYPIYCLSIVGTQNAHNIVSVSNNGRLCLWNSEMLNTPQRSIELKITRDHPMCADCIAFPKQETNNCFIGAEDFNIYHCQIHTE